MARWIAAALVAVLAAAGAIVLLASHYDVSPRFLLRQGLQRAGVEQDALPALLRAPPRFAGRALDGRLRSQQPRILLPELAGWDGRGVAPLIRQRLALQRAIGTPVRDYPACGGARVMAHVACWLSGGDAAQARMAVAAMLRRELAAPAQRETPHTAWEWALAFDLLSRYTGMSSAERARIADKLRDNLRAHLRLLDDEGASLWHARSTLAAQAWLLAVAIGTHAPGDARRAQRAQGHFLQTVRALALTEAWPEGYSYWINNRAVVIALAGAAWVNALRDSEAAPLVRRALRRAALWSVYATHPDDRIEGLGDEGPRVDLKDETRRAIDIIAGVTGDPVLATYSAYLEALHGPESYYRGYRWGFLLFNDPGVPLLAGVPRGTLVGLQRYLPRAELFGRGAMNLFIARSGWAATDTFVSLRAGHTFTHHGHYDAGHFTLFKGSPLAAGSGVYSDFFAPHRLYYALRTVAKNSLLVVRPGDENRPHRLLAQRVNAGGQRLVMPTGSRVRDIDHWRSQLGAGGHYEGGELLDYHYQPGEFAYVRADLTGAYDSTRFDTAGAGGKVVAVERELLYLFAEDRLLLRDKVVATQASYAKKWLLHTVQRPKLADARVVRGNRDGGIAQGSAASVVVQNGPGRLDLLRILPRDATMRLVGGENYRYYIGGDDAASGGAAGSNFSAGAQPRPWFDNAAWRLEIEPRVPRLSDVFLVALSPSLGVDRSREVQALALGLSGAGGDDPQAVATPGYVAVFSGGRRLPELSFTLPGEQRAVLLSGVQSKQHYQLHLQGVQYDYTTARPGVLALPLPPGASAGSRVTLRQVADNCPARAGCTQNG